MATPLGVTHRELIDQLRDLRGRKLEMRDRILSTDWPVQVLEPCGKDVTTRVVDRLSDEIGHLDQTISEMERG